MKKLLRVGSRLGLRSLRETEPEREFEMKPAYYLTVEGVEKCFPAAEEYLLDTDIITVGSSMTNDITPATPDVGTYHLRLIRQGDAYLLEELMAQTGTFLNGSRE